MTDIVNLQEKKSFVISMVLTGVRAKTRTL